MSLYKQIVEAYEIYKAIQIGKPAKESLPQPAKPEVIHNEGEWEEYEKAFKSWQENNDACQKAYSEWLAQDQQAARMLEQIIPEGVAFVMPDGCSISCYLETWGGDHYNIKVKGPDAEPKPEPAHTYYP
jgi:hypothetical protein